MGRFILLILLYTTSLAALASPSDEMGLAIALQIEKRDTGWGSVSAEARMTIVGASGKETSHDIIVTSLELEGEGDKTLFSVKNSPTKQNAGYLTYRYNSEQDSQWLYSPERNSIEHLKLNEVSTPLMESDFFFEDLPFPKIDKYHHRYLRDELQNGRQTFLTERVPDYPHSAYGRLLVWIDKTMYQPVKIEFYDKGNSLMKTLKFYDYQHYAEHYWRAQRMELLHHQTGRISQIDWQNIRFDAGLNERDFDLEDIKSEVGADDPRNININ